MGLRRRYFASSDSYCSVALKQDAALIVYKMRGVCKNSILALGYCILQICRLHVIRSQNFGSVCNH